MRKFTGITALLGLSLVACSFLSRYFDIIPDRARTTVMIVGFTIMFLSSLWRVVIDMNAGEDKRE